MVARAKGTGEAVLDARGAVLAAEAGQVRASPVVRAGAVTRHGRARPRTPPERGALASAGTGAVGRAPEPRS
ncbi:hypothetical protein C8E97_3815 [Saccharothrix australiensis]|uniref:Uncharacterized protein n=1 Tax=Saccharothrix australiensis TaxID=2072 RepID=A0A495W2A5_9PSEU|nr:hypothetical protein C8E97_3815 [Saccharothrix australiensis]